MKYRIESRVDKSAATAIDALVARAQNPHFRQHPGWADVGDYGPRQRFVVFLGEEAGRTRLAALVGIRRMPVCGYSLAEVSRGPMVDSLELMLEGLPVLQEILSPMKLLALRIDPYWSGAGSEEVRQRLTDLGYSAMPDQGQTARRLEIDIDRNPEELLSSFRHQARYNVRKAQHSQIEVREDLDEAGLEMFQHLHRRMALVKGMDLKPAAYFRGIRDYFRAWPQRGFILSSWIAKELLGVVMIFTLGRKAIYGGGGSSLNHPGLPKTHLLHFMAMRRARARGCVVYDIGGVGAGFGDDRARTSLQKMNYFKRSFGGQEVDFVSAHEKILRPVSYRTLWYLNRVLARARLRGNQH